MDFGILRKPLCKVRRQQDIHLYWSGSLASFIPHLPFAKATMAAPIGMLVTALVARLAPTLEKVYLTNDSRLAYSPAFQQTRRSSMKNTALGLLASGRAAGAAKLPPEPPPSEPRIPFFDGAGEHLLLCLGPLARDGNVRILLQAWRRARQRSPAAAAAQPSSGKSICVQRHG